MIPPQVVREVEDLRPEFPEISVHEVEGAVVVMIPRFPVRVRHYTKSEITLLLKAPLSYPNGKPDMFWTDHDFLRVGGSAPKSADTIESILGRSWRRFSWHPRSWNPGTDNLRTYIAFVEVGLQKAVA